MPNQSHPKRKFFIRLGIGVAFFVAILIAGGIYLQNEVKRKLLTELNAIGLGQASIGSIDISFGRVSAKNVNFAATGNNDEPWLTVDSLEINHSLWGLVTGDEVFDQIKISDVSAALNAEAIVDAPSVMAWLDAFATV